MKILLTGAAGFIGSHSTQELLKRGHFVVGMDNLNDYYDPRRKLENLEEVKAGFGGERFEFHKADLRNREEIAQLFQDHEFDAVVNLGAMAGVRVSIEDPHLYYDVNLTGTLNLLLECVQHKVGNFVLASTSSAYGDTEIMPFVETDPCARPLAPYAASKRAAEMLCYTYHHLFGQNCTCLRFFTVYGPRGRPDMMAYKVLDNIFFGEPCPLYNGGEMWRDWTYVSDIANGVASAAERPLGYEIINLGRGEMVKLADFVERIEGLAEKKSNLESAPKLAADIEATSANIDKARRLLDYDPRVSVDEGVKHFYEWYADKVLRQATAL
ncbi:MAG: SDR family NAD(P)-dependent oxidoreductase [Vulcanimicrobiota bacterium]